MNRLKYVLILGVVFFLLSSLACSRVKLLTMATIYDDPPYISFMDSVRKYSKPREKSFQINFNTRDSLYLVEPELVQSFLSGYSTNYPRSWKLDFYDYSTCYYFDYQEYKSWVSFSVLTDNESGYMQLYQYTYQKFDGKITSVSRIGVKEADGGASRDDVLSYSRSGRKLEVRTKYSYAQDNFSEGPLFDCYSLKSDSLVSTFEFYPDNELSCGYHLLKARHHL